MVYMVGSNPTHLTRFGETCGLIRFTLTGPVKCMLGFANNWVYVLYFDLIG